MIAYPPTAIGGTALRLACGPTALLHRPVREGAKALSAPSGNGETDGDSERWGFTGEVGKVFEVAGADSAGIGGALRENSGSVPPERSGSVTPRGRRGVRKPPGDEVIAGFLKGRVGGAGRIPGRLRVRCGSFLLKQRIPTGIEFGAAAVKLPCLSVPLRG